MSILKHFLSLTFCTFSTLTLVTLPVLSLSLTTEEGVAPKCSLRKGCEAQAGIKSHARHRKHAKHLHSHHRKKILKGSSIVTPLAQGPFLPHSDVSAAAADSSNPCKDSEKDLKEMITAPVSGLHTPFLTPGTELQALIAPSPIKFHSGNKFQHGPRKRHPLRHRHGHAYRYKRHHSLKYGKPSSVSPKAPERVPGQSPPPAPKPFQMFPYTSSLSHSPYPWADLPPILSYNSFSGPFRL